MTDGGASLFEGVQSLEDALKVFRTGVSEREHACAQPEACEEPVISVPNCYFLAYAMMMLHLGLARSKEEFWEHFAKPMDEWFQIGLSALEPDDSILVG